MEVGSPHARGPRWEVGKLVEEADRTADGLFRERLSMMQARCHSIEAMYIRHN